jgi:DNA-binding response OmpR family regulator/predicted  nucleic acid-binding Zn-ribbon protein
MRGAGLFGLNSKTYFSGWIMGQRLLVVDSDRSFLKEHQVSLESAFDVEVTGNTAIVSEKLETGAYAAVLICVEVADNKGYAICSSIRRNANLNAVKIALISAKATEDEYKRHQSLKGRADVYLLKPIAPGALVAALTPLAPARSIDPDNPLGDLADFDLGADWLDNIKPDTSAAHVSTKPVMMNEIKEPTTAPNPIAAAITQELARETAPPKTTHADLARQEVEFLKEQLRAKDQRLQQAENELTQLQRQYSSVTQNLDELEKRQQESEQLKKRLAESEAALKKFEESGSGDLDALRVQLKGAMTERQELLHQVDQINQQLSEKTQRTIDLMKERDQLQHDKLELQDAASKLEAATKEFEVMRKEHSAAKTRLETLDPMIQRLPQAELELAAARSEYGKLKDTHNELNVNLAALVEKHESLQSDHNKAQKEAQTHQEKVVALQQEVAGLEATMRGQGRDLAELSSKLGASETKSKNMEQQLLSAEQGLKSRDASLEKLNLELSQLTTKHREVEQAFESSRTQHERERMELMGGIDQKEAELNRLNTAIQSEKDKLAAIEREKQELQGQHTERGDRLQSLGSLLQEITDKLKRGSDLTQG